MRNLLIVTALAPLAGCWLTNAEISQKWDDSDTDTDTNIDQVTPTTEIVSVTPAFGTDAGGTRVTITVDGIGPDLTVTFDGADATVISADGHTIVVETPPGVEGAATVVVASGGSDATATDAYWYWQDGQGRYGTVGAITWTDYVGDLARLGYVDGGVAWFNVIEPTTDGYGTFYGPGLDRCVRGTPTPNHVPYDLASLDVQLDTNADVSGPLSLPYVSSEDAYITSLFAEDYTADADYQLLPFDDVAPFPAFGIDPVAHTPIGLVLLEPNLETVQFAGVLGDLVGRGFNLRWSVATRGTYLTLRLVRFGPDPFGLGSTPVEEVRCLLQDDGAFSLPSDLFLGWDYFSPLNLTLGRVITTETVLPTNRSRNGVVGQYRIAGTVWQGTF